MNAAGCLLRHLSMIFGLLALLFGGAVLECDCRQATLFIMLRYVISCHVMSCYIMSFYVMSCHCVMSCYVVLCYVMSSCHAMLCHVMCKTHCLEVFCCLQYITYLCKI